MTRRLEAMYDSPKAHIGKGRTAQYVGLTVLQKPAAIADGIGVAGYHFNGQVRCDSRALEIPMHWKRPRRIFVNSMSDLFHEKVAFDFVDNAFAVMALCPQHTFQVLTKRPERMAQYFTDVDSNGFDPPNRVASRAATMLMEGADFERRGVRQYFDGDGLQWPLPNVWLGTSVEDQQSAVARIPHLRRCPAAIRFLSVEPLLGPVRLPPVALDGIHWVIVGGESGRGARPCDLTWIMNILSDCFGAEVPVFVKQLGSLVHVPYYDDQFPLREWAQVRPCDTMVPNRTGGWRKHDRLDGQPDESARFRVRMPGKGGDPATWPACLRNANAQRVATESIRGAALRALGGAT
jgi:protein gp37